MQDNNTQDNPLVINAENIRAITITSRAVAQREAHQAEVALRGMYMSWVFDRLNINK